jgi:hypothetical protein
VVRCCRYRIPPDDYQYVAPKAADWLGVTKRAETTVARNRVAKSGAHAERLQPLGVNLCATRTLLRRSTQTDLDQSGSGVIVSKGWIFDGWDGIEPR